LNSKLKVRVFEDRVEIGERFAISFQRTLRIPDDGKAYPLPPTLGTFPLHKVSEFSERVPKLWRKDGIFLPMRQREAMWLAFEAASWKPNAVKIGVGRINALTGEAWNPGLHAKPQDYIVCPNQPWLDGVKSGEDVIRQFVAMPLGEGYTVEAQLTGEERFGGLQVIVIEPKPGIFPDQAPPQKFMGGGPGVPWTFAAPTSQAQEMGMAAGGKMKQKVYPDPYGLETWDASTFGELYVYILNSAQYESVTGQAPPPSPVSAKTYTEYGLPWFELYDEAAASLPPVEKLGGVKSIQEMESERGSSPGEEESSVEIDLAQIKKVDPSGSKGPPRKGPEV
jgi:hypothetical protein